MQRNQHEPDSFAAERCWFSDGGICSNFPVHFFDAPIPRWPTFAINLKQPHREYDQPGSSFVYLPSSCGAGQLASWRRFNPTGRGFADLSAFVAAILNTMKDWRDNLQTRMPGYRNRIAHISLEPNEGGLNITMPPSLIAKLTTRGETAGKALRTEFDFPQHVWTRYRMTMAMLDTHLSNYLDDYNTPSPQAIDVWKRIYGDANVDPKCYAWKDSQHASFAITESKRIAEIGASWKEADRPFQDGAPRPQPQLRAQPRF
jgi:hypothetical protein